MNASFVKAVGDIIHEEYFCLDFCENGKNGISIAGLFDNIVCIFDKEDLITLYVNDIKFISDDLSEVPLLEAYRLENIEGKRCLIIEKQLEHDPLVVGKAIIRLVHDIHRAFNL